MRFMTRILLFLLMIPSVVLSYPIYGSENTGIRRLEAARRAQTGLINGRRLNEGQSLTSAQVGLQLLDRHATDLPQPDPGFSERLVELLPPNKSRYSVCVLDLSNPGRPLYAEHNGYNRQNPGSIGKIAAAIGIFQALADLYPDNLARREQILRETVITADDFINYDTHRVPLWNPHTGKLTHRPLQIGDQGSLWEYLDWTLAASSNAAASMVMKHAMLLAYFKRHYPVSEKEQASFLIEHPPMSCGRFSSRPCRGH